MLRRRQAIAETLAFDYHRQMMWTFAVRIFNTYGPRMLENDGRVVSNLSFKPCGHSFDRVWGRFPNPQFLLRFRLGGRAEANEWRSDWPLIWEQMNTRFRAGYCKKLVNPKAEESLNRYLKTTRRRRRPDITRAKKIS